MKKYSKYYKTMMMVALISLVATITSIMIITVPAVSVLLGTIAFILWYAGIMAPKNEKYTRAHQKKLITDRLTKEYKPEISYHPNDYCEPDYEWENEVRRGR